MRLAFLCFCLLLTFAPQAQIQGKKIKSTADLYFSKQKYVEALNLYQKFQRVEPQDESILSPMGISYLQTGNVDQGLKLLRRVVGNSKKPATEDLFFLGKAYHLSGSFQEAASIFKSYLAAVDDKDERRAMVKDMIRRCGKGLQMIGTDEIAVVENLGESINTVGDEISPIISPNYNNKLYFSSGRFGNVGGMRDQEGKSDELYGFYRTDMFSSYEKAGKWTVPEPMPNLLNSSRNDVILDFTNNGQVLFYFKGNDLVSGEILVDSFSTQETSLFSKSFKGPLNPQRGDISFHFFNDSILVFSSRMDGGEGGLDLYISTWNAGNWSTPQNLGPNINTPYDETTPFLAKDGRTLYFSSNAPKSMGGLDVFSSKYSDNSESWSTARNLGAPINSPGDDNFFRLTKDGLKAYFSSERKGGFGNQDIYVAYFKKERAEQLVTSRPITFDRVPSFRRAQRDAGTLVGEVNPGQINPVIIPDSDGQPIKTFKFRSLYINQNDQVIGPGNIQELEKIAQFLQAYPASAVVLRGHGDGSSPNDFKLYFSIKRSEKASQYLLSKGVNPKQLYLQGFGDQYPIMKKQIESGPKLNAEKYNRRIDYEFIGLAGYPVEIVMEKEKVRDNYLDERGKSFLSKQKGLIYRIQVSAISQNFYLPENLRQEEWIVEKSGSFDGYKYQLGYFTDYKSAVNRKNQLVGSGMAGCFVVPYMNGVTLKRSDALRLMEQYPDLQYYLSDSPQ